jgi:HAD superfamily hydrolase (TIGR01509 family)
MGVDALLFDLGGVVIDIDFGLAFARWAAAARVTPEAIRSRFSFDVFYRRHERGEIGAAEYFASLRSSLGIDLSDAEFADGWTAIYVGEVPGAQALLRSLEARLPLYAFTNTNPTHLAFCRTRYAATFARFRKVFVSSDLGRRKPEPEAFAAIAADIRVPLERILFFDDTRENVEGALAIGMPAVHVRSLDDVAKAVARI